MKIAIYPGSFDPITKGHLDILKNAAGIFDKVIIAVAHNGEKKGFLAPDKRVELIKKSVEEAQIKNVEVDAFEGLTIEYAKKLVQLFLSGGFVPFPILNTKCNSPKQTVHFAMKLKQYFLQQNPNTISSHLAQSEKFSKTMVISLNLYQVR